MSIIIKVVSSFPRTWWGVLDVTFCDLIMKSKFKRWRSTVPSISTKRPITSDLKSLNTGKITTYVLFVSDLLHSNDFVWILLLPLTMKMVLNTNNPYPTSFIFITLFIDTLVLLSILRVLLCCCYLLLESICWCKHTY